MKTMLSLVAAVVLTGCPSNPPLEDDPPDVIKRGLRVHYHTTTTLDNRRADAILAEATEILQTKDGAGDVACKVRLAREGDVTEFSAGDGSIDSGNEFGAIVGPSGHVKLVDEINWCNGWKPNIIGCARPDSSLLVVPTAPELEGVLWAHEYGHTKGLKHRDTGKDAVMYYSVAADHRKVDQAECDAFRKRHDSRRFLEDMLRRGS